VNTRRAAPTAEQLRLPFPTEDPAARLAATADALAALNRALRFLLAIADGDTSPDPAAVAELHQSLDVLATFNLGGRLGHVVRRYRTEPLASAGWGELARELAFAISLYPGEPNR
jgi:hypothetical protein